MSIRSTGPFATNQDLEAVGRANRLAQDEEENFMLPFKLPTSERIKCRLHPKVTFFFDGTGNNLYQELEKPKHEQALANVAKLFQTASQERVLDGATPIYVPGYEDLILAAWDNPAKPNSAVDTLLAAHLHDSVAYFTQFPCTLFEPRKIYCDSEKYHANARPSGPAFYQDAVV